jgi:hypothetical protein
VPLVPIKQLLLNARNSSPEALLKAGGAGGLVSGAITVADGAPIDYAGAVSLIAALVAVITSLTGMIRVLKTPTTGDFGGSPVKDQDPLPDTQEDRDV